MPFILLLVILHYPSFLPWSFTTLPSHLHPTLSFLLYPTLPTLPSLPYTTYYLPFLLSLSYTTYPSFILSYITIPSLYPALPFLLLSILHYPSFSILHYLPFLLTTLHYHSFSLSCTALPFPLHPKLSFFLFILHYPE